MVVQVKVKLRKQTNLANGGELTAETHEIFLERHDETETHEDSTRLHDIIIHDPVDDKQGNQEHHRVTSSNYLCQLENVLD